MKIKINWGTGILITIVLMVLFMLSLVFVATRQDYYLVDDDYYQRGIKYQDQIEKENNSLKLSQKIAIEINNQNINIVFPDEIKGKPISGTIHFYSPVNKNFDVVKNLNVNKSGIQTIEKSKINNGRYIVKIDWKTDDKSYYFEENINLH